jgi:hypothetical protein
MLDPIVRECVQKMQQVHINQASSTLDASYRKFCKKEREKVALIPPIHNLTWDEMDYVIL